jgi:hypothetical protein
MSQKLSHSRERSLSNRPHESSTTPFYYNRIVITERALAENVTDPFDDSVDGSIQAALWYRFLLFEHVVSVWVSKTQTRYRLTFSRPYSARRLETSSDGIMECDASKSKKRERSGRPSLANSSTCSSRMERRICVKQCSYLVDIFFACLRIVPGDVLKVNNCYNACITGHTIYLDRRESPDESSGSVYAMFALCGEC